MAHLLNKLDQLALIRRHFEVASGERQPGQVGQVVGVEGRAEALQAVSTEIRPRWAADVGLQYKVPLLGDSL